MEPIVGASVFDRFGTSHSDAQMRDDVHLQNLSVAQLLDLLGSRIISVEAANHVYAELERRTQALQDANVRLTEDKAKLDEIRGFIERLAPGDDNEEALRDVVMAVVDVLQLSNPFIVDVSSEQQMVEYAGYALQGVIDELVSYQTGVDRLYEKLYNYSYDGEAALESHENIEEVLESARNIEDDIRDFVDGLRYDRYR